MQIQTAVLGDLEQMLEIYNYEVRHGVATFDLRPRTMEEQRKWFFAHNVKNHPLLVAKIDGAVAGYASLSAYREKEAYQSTVELSVYVGIAYRKRGIGTALMEKILAQAKQNADVHTVISVITSGNMSSVKLHERYGFQYCGTTHEVGYKMGKFQDTDYYELLI